MDTSHYDVPDAVRDALGWIGGGLLAVSLLPQIVQLVRTGSAEDMSLLFGVIYFFGNALTVVYMVLVGALATWIPVVIEIVLCIVTMTLKLIYDHRDSINRQQQQLRQQQLQQWHLQPADLSASAQTQDLPELLKRHISYLGLPGQEYAAGQLQDLNDSALGYGITRDMLHSNADRDSAHSVQQTAAAGSSESAASAPTVLNSHTPPSSLWQLSTAADPSNHSAGPYTAQTATAAAAAAATRLMSPGLTSCNKLPWYCQSGISHVRSMTPRHAVRVCPNCGTVSQCPYGGVLRFRAPASSAAATAGSVITSDLLSGHCDAAKSHHHAPAATTAAAGDNHTAAAAAAVNSATYSGAAAGIATDSDGIPGVVLEPKSVLDQLVSATSGAVLPASLPLSASQTPSRQATTDAEVPLSGNGTAAATAATDTGLSRLSRVTHACK